MSNERTDRKLIRLTRQRMAETGEDFETAGIEVLREDPCLAADYLATMNEETEAEAEVGEYSYLTPQQATRKILELTRQHMVQTGEKDFARASYKVLEAHPELVKRHLQG